MKGWNNDDDDDDDDDNVDNDNAADDDNFDIQILFEGSYEGIFGSFWGDICILFIWISGSFLDNIQKLFV